VVNVPAGTELALTEPNAEAKIGVNGQWVRVRTAQGQEGFAAAWFLEKVAGAAPTPVTEPAASPVNQTPTSSSGSRARVMATVTAGLNVRSSTDTSSMANLVANVPAGTELALTESNAEAKIGVNGQWVRVRTAQGLEGFAAAWFLEKVAGAAPAPVTEPAPSPINEAPVPVSTNPAPVNEPAATSPSTTKVDPSTPAPTPPTRPVKIQVAVIANGTKIYATATSASVIAMAKANAQLTVLEATDGAKAKIGVKGKRINVKDSSGRRGFVDGDKVKLA
jgi:hypothetical protein